jgi:co-chaperonin GroES (HSP10)
MNVAKLAKKYGCENWDKYRPMRNFVVVMDDPVEEKTEAGIWMPPKYRQGRWLHTTGTVMRVGRGEYNSNVGKFQPPPLKVGQRVIYGRQFGSRLEDLSGNDQFLRLMDPSQILGIVDEEG